MKTLPLALLFGLFPLLATAAQPWQEISVPTVSEAAASFANPPKEYGAIHWATGFPAPKERIQSDIANLDANGGSVYMINSGGRTVKYLSPEYFDLMKVAIDELKKRGMKMWIDGDDGYPDGLAGGEISRQYPQLGMQGIVADARFTVAAGQTLDIPLPVDTLGIIANLQITPPAPATPVAAAPAADTTAPASVVPTGSGTAPAGRAGRGGARGAAGARGRGPVPFGTLTAPIHQVLPLPTDGKFKWTGSSGATWEVTFQGSPGEPRYSVVAGQTLTIPLPSGTTGIVANARPAARGGQGGRRGGAGPAVAPPPPTIVSVPADGHFKWTAPGTGTWEVTFVRHVYRSSPTRYGQRDDGTRDKDSLYTLIDYLDPQATATYIKLVPETYMKYFGDDFGKTILGFRGDETDYTGFDPWTPKLLATFQKQKGYDLQPYIAGFFATPMTDESKRAYADYFDVWSGMFRDNFYKPMEEWCQAHGMDYMMHLNHEETMISRFGGESMTKNEGSFYRDMRYIGVPGVDNLNQIGPGIVADFPKIAASAAHLNGRPQAWSEEGGSTAAGGKFIFDYQLVRGLNFMNIRGLNTAADPAAASDPTAATGWYITRAQHLMTLGRPAAQVALYIPIDSYWLGDMEADAVTVKLTTELMEHQVDFDHIDQDSLASLCTLQNGGLKNLSGQVYHAVIVPTSTVIQKSVLDRLRAFAKAGGKVVFVGRTPSMVVDQTFLHPVPGTPDLSFATLEPTPEITDRVIAALPTPDVKLDAACPPLKYLHRTFKDGELYMFFNESDQPQTVTATVVGSGKVQVWDAASGTIHPATGTAKPDGHTDVPLALGPQETRFIVIGPLPANATQASISEAQRQPVVALNGN